MTALTYGELFAGYGGLGMGVQSVLGGRTAWVSEFDAAPSRVLAHHWPDAPNLGDITRVDWHTVEPVDILTGGSPCQDLSGAGKRAGMTPGTRSNLWVQMREAVAVLRPRLVVWENVRGSLSAHAASAVEPCPGCVGGPDDGQPVLRALGRVAGDLAELGYDTRWYGLRAADVGGAHGRFRVFLYATPADPTSSGRPALPRQRVSTARAGTAAPASPHGGSPALTLLPTPSVADGMGGHLSRSGSRSDELLLPGVAKELAGKLLPTPTSADHKASGSRGYGGNDFSTLTDATVRNPQDWREYAAAIARAEHATGRTAPPPTEPGAKGNPRLSPAFVEWLMMLPAGHVTAVPGLTRNALLKMLGNGVVPAQAAAATRQWLTDAHAGVAA